MKLRARLRPNGAQAAAPYLTSEYRGRSDPGFERAVTRHQPIGHNPRATRLPLRYATTRTTTMPSRGPRSRRRCRPGTREQEEGSRGSGIETAPFDVTAGHRDGPRRAERLSRRNLPPSFAVGNATVRTPSSDA
jgi:hypothetical protein